MPPCQTGHYRPQLRHPEKPETFFFLPHIGIQKGKSEDYAFTGNNKALFLNQWSCSLFRLPDRMRLDGLKEWNLYLTPLISQNSVCDLLKHQHKLLQTNILVPCREITVQFSPQKARFQHVGFQMRNEFRHDS